MEDHLSVICGTDKGWTQGQVISMKIFKDSDFSCEKKAVAHERCLTV